MADVSILAAGSTELSADSEERIVRLAGMDTWVVNYTVYGEAVVGRGEDAFTERVGDLLLVPPDVPHDYGHAPGTGWVHLWAEFAPTPELESALLNWPEQPGHVRLIHLWEAQSRQRVIGFLESMKALMRGPLPVRREVASCLLEAMFRLCDHFNPRGQYGRPDERILAAQAYLCQQYRRSIRLPEVAAVANLSISRFSERFHAETGMTPMKYLETVRIRRARELLRMTAYSVSEIAAACGFACPFHFSRVFKAHVGRSPSHYRDGEEA